MTQTKPTLQPRKMPAVPRVQARPATGKGVVRVNRLLHTNAPITPETAMTMPRGSATLSPSICSTVRCRTPREANWLRACWAPMWRSTELSSKDAASAAIAVNIPATIHEESGFGFSWLSYAVLTPTPGRDLATALRIDLSNGSKSSVLSASTADSDFLKCPSSTRVKSGTPTYVITLIALRSLLLRSAETAIVPQSKSDSSFRSCSQLAKTCAFFVPTAALEGPSSPGTLIFMAAICGSSDPNSPTTAGSSVFG